MALQQGQAETALEQAEAPVAYSGEPALAAWSALLTGRAALQHDDQDKLLDRYETWLHALASVLNITGLLAMRMEDPSAAAGYHLRAAALFGIVGDYPSLQGALFNLANSRRRAQLQEQRSPDEAVFKLVELCRLVCKRFGVGADSAQAEIFAARSAFEMGDLPRALQYLADAEVIIERIEASFDQASFLLLRAELEQAHPLGEHDPVRDLQTAERLFLDVEDDRSAAEARRLLATVSPAHARRRP